MAIETAKSVLHALIRFWQKLAPVPRILLSTFIVIFLLLATRPEAPEKPTIEQRPRVSYETVQPARIAPQIRLFGRVQSPSSALIRAAVTGTVEQIPALNGQRVAKGEVILSLDQREASLALTQRQAEMDQAQAQLESMQLKHDNDLQALEQEQELLRLAKRSVERFSSLKGKGVGSDTQLDQARQAAAQQQISLNQRKLVIADYKNELQRMQAQLDRATAQRDQAALDLERTQIQAPFAGRINAVHVAPGERVRPGDMLISLYATNDLEIRAQIPERHLPQVREALADSPMQAHTIVEGNRIPLQLVRLAGEVATGRGGLDGLFRIITPDFAPELGRTTDTFLALPARDQLIAIPPQALHGIDRIYRITKEEQLDAIQIERIGDWYLPSGEQRLLIASDQLQAGDPIMVSQLPGAISGLTVNPMGGDPTPAPAQPQADTSTKQTPTPAPATSQPETRPSGEQAGDGETQP